METEWRVLYRSERGGLPWVALNCFAWLARPTPPENRRKGITWLCSVTSLRYVYALVNLRPRFGSQDSASTPNSNPPQDYTPESAAATSRMFLKCVRRYSPRAREAVNRDIRLVSKICRNWLEVRTFFWVGGKGGGGVSNCIAGEQRRPGRA